MCAKVLLIEDEVELVKGLKRSLESEGLQVDVAYDGRQGLEAALTGRPDIVLLDVMLPEIDGFEVCRHIRERSQVPIIMLTARSDDVDKVVGLELGADDYLAKPFNTRELLARMWAVLRRVRHCIDREVLRLGSLEIDLERRTVSRDGLPLLELTNREFELLLFLASHPGRVFTREHILEAVWDYDYYGDTRAVDIAVRRLRQKIEPDPSRPVYVRTRWGVGYYCGEGDE